MVFAHMSIIQLYYVKKDELIKPRVINTSVIESLFGNMMSMVGGTRTTVGGTTNKLQAKPANVANRKSGAFNRGRHTVVGNDKSRTNSVFKREQNRIKD